MKFNIVLSILLGIFVSVLPSCSKEMSEENGSGTDSLIVGADCRLARIVYKDSSGFISLGSIAANINATDNVVNITEFDSLSNFLVSFASVSINGDTIHVSPDEYFIANSSTKIISKFHGLVDPGNASSPTYEQVFSYNAGGNLIKKTKSLSMAPLIPYEQVDYTYSNGNLVSMQNKNIFTAKLISDASFSFYNTIIPKNYIYIFADEEDRPQYNQFFNFGKPSVNAVNDFKVRYYDGGGTLIDSAISKFINYQQSADTYVQKVQLTGDDQLSIPAQAGKLQLSYHCK